MGTAEGADPRTYRVEGMDCANCARELEQGVSRLDGVNSVRVDFAAGKLVMSGAATLDVLQNRAKALGFSLVDPDSESGRPAAEARAFLPYLMTRPDTRAALAGGVLLLVAVAAMLLFGGGIVADGLLLASVAVAGWPLALGGFRTLLINRDFNINLLMTIAAVGAVLLGEMLEAAIVVFLFAIGEALEGYTSARARDSIRGLMDLAPAVALRLRDGTEETVPVADLQVGDTVLVKAGERIPADGDVATGESGVDQAPITGESVPVHRGPGDQVFAGTINGMGALTITVTRPAEDSTLSRIIRMVEEAQSARAPSQRLVDRFSRYYTPTVVIAAALIAIVPPLFFGEPLLEDGSGHGWLYRALAMLVIACPCALVISTPVTVISAITASARRGVLIKGGAFLEALGAVKAVAFDKTGTLTAGEPVVTHTRAFNCDDMTEGCPVCADVLALAAAVEGRSAHPLARAVMDAARVRGVMNAYAPAEQVETLAGRGVRGQVGGDTITVGSHPYFHELAAKGYPHPDEFCQRVSAVEASGATAMLVGDTRSARGYVAVADTVRPESREVINALHGMGMDVSMLTGDNAAAAGAVAAQLGVDDVRSGLLPEDKLAAVDALRAKYGSVVMVGDGINDTPALAAASVSVAMGGAGSPQALETADVALMADDLSQLPYALRLARFARRLIVQNVALSFGVKAVFLTLAVAGLTSLWLAILADVGMLLVVALNGMRPLRYV